MRLSAVAAAFVMLAGSAWGQTPLTGTTGSIGSPTVATPGSEQVAPPAGTASPRRGRSLQDRFDAANVTHDGHLTMEQARSKMPSVARDFSAMDTDNKGYVTIEQIRDHAKAVRAARRAAAHTTPAK
jgi:hypothetical protein